MQDGQGSTRTLTNSAGYITDTYNYTAFGELQNETGTTENKYLYTGQQFDKSTGLYDLRARFYSPNVGRFLSQDTYAVNYGNPIELNRYGYAGDNPINFSDPSGMMAEYGGLTLNRVQTTAAVAFVIGVGIYYTFSLVANLVAQDAIAPPFPRLFPPTLPGLPPIDWRRVGEMGKVVTLTALLIKTLVDEIERVKPREMTKKQEKHITLGRWEYLGAFTVQLNIALKPRNAVAYMWGDWFSSGLSDVGASMMNETFHLAFEQAITKADHIHFNLQGIIDPKEWAEKYGMGSVYSNAEYVTAWELYNIYHNPAALSKTTFYPAGFTSLP